MTPEQRTRVEDLSAGFQRECRGIRTRMRERRRDLFRLLAAPETDDATIAARMGEIAGLQAALQQRMVRHLLAVREILTPEQQRKLFDLLDEAMQEDLRRIE
jgi:Spy/CpxP family protein refolding chaperone